MIPKKNYYIIVEICCLICLIGTLLFLIINWNSIPDEVPGHYNAVGEIDGVTGKYSLIILLMINWVMYIGMSVIERFPQIWNTGVKVTEENKYRVYCILKDMLKMTKLIIVILFTYLTINSARAMHLHPWFTPVSLILVFGTLIFYIIKLLKNK